MVLLGKSFCRGEGNMTQKTTARASGKRLSGRISLATNFVLQIHFSTFSSLINSYETEFLFLHTILNLYLDNIFFASFPLSFPFLSAFLSSPLVFLLSFLFMFLVFLLFFFFLMEIHASVAQKNLAKWYMLIWCFIVVESDLFQSLWALKVWFWSESVPADSALGPQYCIEITVVSFGGAL